MISLLGNPSSVACSTSRLCRGNLLPRNKCMELGACYSLRASAQTTIAAYFFLFLFGLGVPRNAGWQYHLGGDHQTDKFEFLLF